MKRVFTFLLLIAVSLVSGVHAEEVTDKEISLRSIIASIEGLEGELSSVQAELGSERSKGREEELRAEISSLDERIENLRDNFTEISTGVETSIFRKDDKAKNVQWTKELTELLSPLLSEVKQLTSRPREIDALKSQINGYQTKLSAANDAVRNIDTAISEATQESLISALSKERRAWLAKQQNVGTLLKVAQQKLDQKIGEKKPLSETLSELSQIFFKSRGRNLLFSLLVTLLFWFGLNRIALRIRSSRKEKGKTSSLTTRLFNVAFLLLASVGSIGVFMLMLFLFEDWVLLTLGLLVVLGIIWTSKQALPMFWTQATVLLNMGVVREGERIFHNGIPWKVKQLTFYTTLENPLLDGGELRLPVKDLLDLRSRPFASSEQWFPTTRGDWVKLSDDTYGEVIHQSPEWVRVQRKGGSIKSYKTEEFLEQVPENISNGFRISFSFGVDYAHQEIVTKKIPSTMEKYIVDGLVEAGFERAISKIEVEFGDAGASSLNLKILANFGAGIGSKYQIVERALHRLCVEACNKNGWIIPFEQLTLHVADGKVAST